MAKSIAQRLAALEKAVAEFIGVRPKSRPKRKKAKAGGRTARKTAKKSSRAGGRKKKSARRRSATALAFPPD